MLRRKIKSISIILPAYKQEKTIVEDIERLKKFLSGLTIPYELILVVDGLDDNTYKNAKPLKNKNVRIFCYKKNKGKGHAVQYGMLKARGDAIGFIDAGMDLDVSGIGMLLEYMLLQDADIVIGSKLHPDSVVKYPVQRKILSWGYRTLTQTLFGFGVRDTQVGLKLFRKKLVKEVFPQLLVKRFAFDVEILAVSYAKGYRRIYEAPVRLTFNWGSTIANFTSLNFWKVIFSMLWDTVAVFYRLKVLHFYDHPVRKLKKPKLAKKHYSK
jgi:glycosyltransferase involved in cell wall biosynthesis